MTIYNKLKYVYCHMHIWLINCFYTSYEFFTGGVITADKCISAYSYISVFLKKCYEQFIYLL